MSSIKTAGSKEAKLLLKTARRNGARIVPGKKHIKVFDGNELVVVLSYGGGVRDTKKLQQTLNMFRKRGWKV